MTDLSGEDLGALQASPSVPTEAPKVRFLCSWYGESGTFEIHSPWWISGMRCSDDADTICAAVLARDEEDAASIIRAAHDDPTVAIEWRFINPLPDDWSPFCDRFQQANWMVWPEATAAAETGAVGIPASCRDEPKTPQQQPDTAGEP